MENCLYVHLNNAHVRESVMYGNARFPQSPVVSLTTLVLTGPAWAQYQCHAPAVLHTNAAKLIAKTYGVSIVVKHDLACM